MIAAIYNSNPYRKGKPVTAERFNPYSPRRGRGRGTPLTKHTLGLLAIAMRADGAPTPGR